MEEDLSPTLAAVGPRLRALAAAARHHPHRPGGADRRLGEHAVPARVRRPQAHPGAAASPGPGLRCHPRRTRRRAADRRSPGPPAPDDQAGHDDDPADAAGRRHPGLQADHSRRRPGRRQRTRSADTRGLRVGLRAQRPSAPRARRARPDARARRGGRVRHPRPALVRPRRRRAPSSSSACSAAKDSARTCAPARVPPLPDQAGAPMLGTMQEQGPPGHRRGRPRARPGHAARHRRGTAPRASRSTRWAASPSSSSATRAPTRPTR